MGPPDRDEVIAHLRRLVRREPASGREALAQARALRLLDVEVRAEEEVPSASPHVPEVPEYEDALGSADPTGKRHAEQAKSEAQS